MAAQWMIATYYYSLLRSTPGHEGLQSPDQGLNPGHGRLPLYELLTSILAQNKNKPHYEVKCR